jgi:hypothetical protein
LRAVRLAVLVMVVEMLVVVELVDLEQLQDSLLTLPQHTQSQ